MSEKMKSLTKQYLIKGSLEAQYSTDIQEWISVELFEARINEFNETIKKYSVGFFRWIYALLTFSVIVIGLPITLSNVNAEEARAKKSYYYVSYSWYYWRSYILISLAVYVLVFKCHWITSIWIQRKRMKKLVRIFVEANASDNPNSINWVLHHESGEYYVKLELNSPTIKGDRNADIDTITRKQLHNADVQTNLALTNIQHQLNQAPTFYYV
ncbi:3157_t:CDS:2 [Ambispora leptoticha]|uniref:3157_t:CDS:1 n=1 Tax=Ambispora leptoticha TaxID=144679 RepID=A0A9N8W7H4_9GLOM|nr:3157_t:CDS:2 [Ambispora leptoticha]